VPGHILGRLADLSDSSILLAHRNSPILGIAGFYKRKSKADQPSCGVETESIDATLKAIKKAGGKVVTPKHSIDEWGFMADFADPEGNVLSLWEKPKP